MPTVNEIPHRLRTHLETWLGAWPPKPTGITVVGHAPRSQPGWDKAVHDVVGVASTEAALLSVPPQVAAEVAELVRGKSLAEDLDALQKNMAKVLGRAGRVGCGRFRWTESPANVEPAGEWVPTTDERVPDWLKPFNGDVLIEWDDDGRYGAGVGRKMHDNAGHEISVGTEESLRGRGIARRLVSTAAHHIISDGAIPTYLHAFDNYASDKVAHASGFADVGWTILGFWPEELENE